MVSNMFGDRPRESYALLEEKFTPIGARLVVWSVVGGAAAFGLLGIGKLLVAVRDHVVLPTMAWLTPTSLPAMSGPSVLSVVISLAVTVLLLALVAYLTIGWVRGTQKVLMNVLMLHLSALHNRIGNLEANAADVKDTKDAVSALMRRVTALEPQKPMPKLRSPDGAVEALNRVALMRALEPDASASIRSVGKPPGDTVGPMDGQGEYRISLATDNATAPQLTVAGRDIQLASLTTIANRDMTWTDKVISGVTTALLGFVAALLVTTAGSLVRHWAKTP